tara:strand:+ start:392 stop:556 length:165 start_codon:yes stop_codon:yes gene_type:complete
MDRHYKIQELVTTGWEDVSAEWNQRLSKEQCDEHLQDLIGGGISPQRIRIQRVD